MFVMPTKKCFSFFFSCTLSSYFPSEESRRLKVIRSLNAGSIWQLKIVSEVFKDDRVMHEVITILNETRTRHLDTENKES
jgi:hypothetical protein